MGLQRCVWIETLPAKPKTGKPWRHSLAHLNNKTVPQAHVRFLGTLTWGTMSQQQKLRCFLLHPLGHFSVELFRAFFDFFRAHVHGVSAQAPGLAKRIHKTAEAITPEHIHDRHGYLATGINGTLKSFIDVFHIEIEAASVAAEGLGRLTVHARHFIRNKNDGVADLDLSV